MIEKKDMISVKELIRQLKTWILYLWSKSLIIVLFSVLVGFVGYIYSIRFKPSYTGKLTFVLATESKGNGLSGLASQFGLDLGSSSNDAFTGQNVLGLMSSQKILHKVFFKKIPEVNDILANLIAKEVGFDKAWKDQHRTEKLFPFPVDDSKLTIIQDSLIRELFEVINDNYLKLSKPEKSEFFFSVTATSRNEIIAVYLPKYIVDETALLYINTKTAQARKNLNMLQFEADSLRDLLSGSISATSRSIDRTFNLNPALQERRSSIQEGQVKTTIVSTAYAEVLKNLEIAKINLQRDTPLYQVIDSPEIPLKVQTTSRKKYFLYGFLLGGFMIIAFLVLKKVLREILRD